MIKTSFVSKRTLKGADNDLFGVVLYNLVNKYIRRLAGKFYSVLSQDDIDDLVHDAYEKVLSKRHQFKADGNFHGWVFRICQNLVRDLTPKASEARYWNPSYDNASQYETLSKIYFVDCHFATDKDIIEQESLDYIWNAIDRLDDDGRRIVEMLIEDTPNAEIAKVLGYTDGNLRVKIHRIRKTLKSYGLCG